MSPSAEIIRQLMEKKGIYSYGLTQDDIRYIELLKRTKILGVRAISHTLNIPEKTVKNNMEPYLLKLRLISILPSMQNRRSINKLRVIEMGL